MQDIEQERSEGNVHTMNHISEIPGRTLGATHIRHDRGSPEDASGSDDG